MKNMFELCVLAMAVMSVFCPADASAQDMSISTNLASCLNLGTMNLEASCPLGRHWSLTAGALYNPFSYENQKTGQRLQNRQQSYALGMRWWPWHIYSGWWLSGNARYQEYNSGGIRSEQTSEGDRYGMSFGGGYSYMLFNHLNLEFGLGLWGGRDIYRTYSCPRCGRVVDMGRRWFVRPQDILVGFAYVF